MKIAIYGHYYKEDTRKYFDILLDGLESKNADIYIEAEFLDLIQSDSKLSKSYKTYNSHLELDSSFDFFFTLGGDGTILRSITFLRDSNIPVIGVNIGRLGFLAMVKKEEINEAIEALVCGNYIVKDRSLLKVEAIPENEDLSELNYALNEITLSRKDTASMITIETYLDNEYLTSYWADGLIISTPTGSTGYSLSCGGPIITPEAKSFVLTPVAPHNLNARPLIIPESTKIKMRTIGRENEFSLSLDSRITIVQNTTEIFIEKAPFSIKMIELTGNSFIKTLRKKLLWGEDTRNK